RVRFRRLLLARALGLHSAAVLSVSPGNDHVVSLARLSGLVAVGCGFLVTFCHGVLAVASATSGAREGPAQTTISHQRFSYQIDCSVHRSRRIVSRPLPLSHPSLHYPPAQLYLFRILC